MSGLMPTRRRECYLHRHHYGGTLTQAPSHRHHHRGTLTQALTQALTQTPIHKHPHTSALTGTLTGTLTLGVLYRETSPSRPLKGPTLLVCRQEVLVQMWSQSSLPQRMHIQYNTEHLLLLLLLSFITRTNRSFVEPPHIPTYVAEVPF